MRPRHGALAACAALILAPAILCLSCGGGFSGAPRKLVVWSPSREFGELLDYFRLENPVEASKYDIEFVYSGDEGYLDRLEAALSGGSETPDLFVAEASTVKRLAESGLCQDLSSLKKSYSDAFPYTLDMSRDQKGRVCGLTWEIAPGAYFYRRSIAAKYLGTDDPTKIQSMIQDSGKFMAAAELLKQKSAGRAVMIPSLGDLYQVYKAGRRDGWVRGGKLIIDPIMILLLEQAKAFYVSGYTGNQSQMGEGWYAALRGELKDDSGKSVEVLGCFLPAWGLEYLLKPNSTSTDGKSDSSGDWAMAQGPIPYSWGGSWLMANSCGKEKKAALKLIELLCADRALLEGWALERGRPVSSVKVMDEIKKRYSDPFLGGQNSFSAYASIARSVNGKNQTSVGPAIDDLWQKQQSAFVIGDKDIQKAISDFKTEVRNRFPDIQTE